MVEALTEDSPIVKQGQALAMQDQRVWSLLENISVFCYGIETLSNRSQGGENVIEFDKDDKDTLDFVASAANLRSHIFGIQLHSEWDIKQMAGNIIPAIATSNALTASLCVLESFKILRSQTPRINAQSKQGSSNANSYMTVSGKDEGLLGGSKTVFLVSKSTERLITPQPLAPPNPQCPVCSPTYAKLILPADGSPKIQDVADLLKKQAGYEDFSISVNDTLIYDPDLDDNLQKPLSDFGVDGTSNGFITVLDDSDEPRVDLILSTPIRSGATTDGEATGLRLVPDRIDLPLKVKTEQADGEANGVLAVHAEPIPGSGTKRKREAEDEIDGAAKKARANNDDSVYIVEDDGAILLDD